VSVSVSVKRGVQSDCDSNLGGRQLCFQFTHHDSFEFNLHMARLHGGLGLKVAHVLDHLLAEPLSTLFSLVRGVDG